jgi:hypothetical protein
LIDVDDTATGLCEDLRNTGDNTGMVQSEHRNHHSVGRSFPRTHLRRAAAIDSRRCAVVRRDRYLFVDIRDQLLNGGIVNRATQTLVNRSGDSVNQVFIGHGKSDG